MSTSTGTTGPVVTTTTDDRYGQDDQFWYRCVETNTSTGNLLFRAFVSEDNELDHASVTVHDVEGVSADAFTTGDGKSSVTLKVGSEGKNTYVTLWGITPVALLKAVAEAVEAD